MKNCKKVLVVSGHGKGSSGYQDNGASATDGTTERGIVVEIGKYLEKFLEEWREGSVETFGVHFRKTLNDKITKINAYCKNKGLDYKNSILVSIHADWSGAREGVGGYFYRGSTDSRKLLVSISEEVAKVGERESLYQKPDTSSRFGSLGIIKNTSPLAVLIEIGSLKSDNNTKDGLELLTNTQSQKDIAFGIFKGILNYISEELPEKTCDCEDKINLAIDVNSEMWKSLDTMQQEIEKMKASLSEVNKELRK